MFLNSQRVNYRIPALDEGDFSVFVGDRIDIIMSSTCSTRNAIKAGGGSNGYLL